MFKYFCALFMPVNTAKSSKKEYDLISVSHYFHPRVGGLEKIATELSKAAGLSSLKVASIFGVNELRQVMEIPGVDQYPIKVNALFNQTYPIMGIKFAWKLFNLLRTNPGAVTLIHDRHLTSSVVAWIICKIVNRPYILISHTTKSNYFRNRLFEMIGNLLDMVLFRFVVLHAEQVISVSETNKLYLMTEYGLLPDKVTVIYNGFTTSMVQKFPIQPKEKTVVYATKWIPVKDPDTVARAFRRLAKRNREWEFYFIGEGNSEIINWGKLPLNLKFINRFYSQAELFDLLGRSAIYVNASLNEGLPVAVIEAAALANHMVLSDAPSNIEVAHKLGVKHVFARKSVASLVKNIQQVINRLDKNLIPALSVSENSYKYFADSKMFARYLEIIKAKLMVQPAVINLAAKAKLLDK